MDQRNLRERLVKTEEEEDGRCRRALGCELVYGTMKSCSEAAKQLRVLLALREFGGGCRRAHIFGMRDCVCDSWGQQGKITLFWYSGRTSPALL